ncbi:MAG: DNA methylase [Bacteroidaceae bacterium]|nr:DNA methylase [Bacteroidaceae bacterium]
MQTTERTYIAIDLKSFFASVECVERGLDPLDTNLVVADTSRTEKTICLAVTPSLKAYGISGRARLFEVIQRVRQVNEGRRLRASGYHLNGKSYSDAELKAHPDREVDYIAAPPRMSYYLQYSNRIYDIYLKYIAPEDIHVYSIDEVFIDATGYLSSRKMSARELAMTMIRDVLRQTGITATAGIGPNLYLCKVAMDIVAKHIPADKDGVRIAGLDEMTYRRELWNHRPLTSFWRVGQGTADRLAVYGIDTMGKLARCSIEHEELLYSMFGVNAELLIDHAWGWEPCTISDIRAYRPESASLSNGQVLSTPYDTDKARVVIHEMADAAALRLVRKHLVTNQITVTIGYDASNLTDPGISPGYDGKVRTDHYGRKVPGHSNGTARFESHTSSTRLISEAAVKLYNDIVNPNLLIRRLNISTDNLIGEGTSGIHPASEQLDLFTDYEQLEQKRENERKERAKERRMQEALIDIKQKFGKNAILKGLNFQEGATAIERNRQIGGHKA